jgi:hypothetical protein
MSGVRPGDSYAAGWDAAIDEAVCKLANAYAGAHPTDRNIVYRSEMITAVAQLHGRSTQEGAGASSDAAPAEREAATRSGDAAPAPGKGALIWCSCDAVRGKHRIVTHPECLSYGLVAELRPSDTRAVGRQCDQPGGRAVDGRR